MTAGLRSTCRIRLRCIALLSVLLGAAATTLHAQSRRPFSLQASGEYVVATKDYGAVLQSGATLGWEVQGRYTRDRLSIGVGYERTLVFKSAAADLKGTLSIGFVEPRYVVAVVSERWAPYVAARVGYGKLLIRDVPRVTENSLTYGGGLGVLLAASSSVSIDVGVQYFAANFGGGGGTAGYVLGRVGVAVGLF